MRAIFGAMMFEPVTEPLISRQAFANRLFIWFGATFIIFAISLGIGVCGYHYFAGLAWVDAFLNASMILGGMGPVDIVQSNAGKIFSSLYAIYSGFFLVVAGGLLLVPVFHRVLHHFHAESE